MKIAIMPSLESKKFNRNVWLVATNMEPWGAEFSFLTPETLMTEKFDVLHVNFFEGYTYHRNPFKILKKTTALLKAIDHQRKMGAKLIYTAHDAIGHDTPWRSIEKWFLQEFINRVDGVIFLSKLSENSVRELYPSLTKLSTIIPHCTYDGGYDMSMPEETAREKLNIAPDEFVITHLGLIKGYKNVPQLVRSFSGLEGKYRLVIAGRILEESLKLEIETEAKKDPRVSLYFGHIEEEDIQTYMKACNLAAFPYKSILNSGSAMLALTFKKPILVPHIGSMPELQQIVPSPWVCTYEGDISTANLKKAVDVAQGIKKGEGPNLDALMPAKSGEEHYQFFEKVCNKK